MSIRDRVSQLLPPTNRFFSATIRSLHDHIENEVIESSRAASDAIATVADDIAKSLHDINSSYEPLFNHYCNYGNVEYLQASLLNNSAKNILLVGWYGAQNLGDELMMKTILSYMPDAIARRTTVLLWDNPNYPRYELDTRVSVLHYPTTTWQIEALANIFDVVIWGGGANIDDKQHDSDYKNCNTGNLLILLSQMMLARGKAVYAVGLSTNSDIKSDSYVKKLANIISSSDYFSIRDPYSIKTLNNAGISQGISQTEDIVFANKDLNKSKPESHVAAKRNSIGVVAICDEKYEVHYHNLLVFLQSYVKSSSIFDSITLIPFYNEGDHDVNFYHRLLQGIESDDLINISSYSESEPLKDCSFCICYKYHAAVIASMLSIPYIVVCADEHPHYPNKMKHIADISNNKEHMFTISDLDKNDMTILSEAIDNNHSITPGINSDVIDIAVTEITRLINYLE